MESYWETRSNNADYRVQGISISTVKLQDARRQNNVTKLIKMFEKHQQKAQYFKDMKCRRSTSSARNHKNFSTTSTKTETRSTVRRKRKHFENYVGRKIGWRYYGEPRGNPSAASSSSTSQWQGYQWRSNWSSWHSTSSEKWW